MGGSYQNPEGEENPLALFKPSGLNHFFV